MSDRKLSYIQNCREILIEVVSNQPNGFLLTRRYRSLGEYLWFYDFKRECSTEKEAIAMFISEAMDVVVPKEGVIK